MDNTKVKHKIKSVAIDIVIVLVAIAFVFYGNLIFESKPFNPVEDLLDGLLTICVGLTIKLALAEQGMIKGYDSETYVQENEKYNQNCIDSLDYIEYADDFTQEMVSDRKANYRKTKLQGYRLKYNDFFTENGEIKDVIITKKTKITSDKNYQLQPNEFVLDRKQRKALDKCYKVSPKVMNLYSEYSNDNTNVNDKEITDLKRRESVALRNIVGTIGISLLGVYFAVKLGDWNWGEFILSCIQVCGFVAGGITQLYGNINYICRDKVAILREKSRRLSVFINKCKKGTYTNERVVEKELVADSR